MTNGSNAAHSKMMEYGEEEIVSTGGSAPRTPKLAGESCDVMVVKDIRVI